MTIRCFALFCMISLVARSQEPPVLTKPVPFNTQEADAIVSRMQIFPKDNAWNADITRWPIAHNSKDLINSIGPNLKLRSNHDMAYILVPPNQKLVEVKITGYPDESDKGPYPVPDDLPIEGWPSEYRTRKQGRLLTLLDVQRDVINENGDRHAIVVDPTRGKLYEFYQMKRTDRGWEAAQASIFDLNSNTLRPAGWTSADAAGLPIFPAVVRYDEIQQGEIKHAIRFTVPKTRRACVHPATHFASKLDDPKLPRMGERFRLRGDFNLTGFSKETQVVLRALQKHGMILADNGIAWGMSFAPDERMKALHEELRLVTGKDFQVVIDPLNRGSGTK
ncbi:MAG TPA: hypothetical protein PLN21_15230 [Gemmatales bacterium]|nr:hypothetical protein [Gemmatales bacterium]